MGTSRSVAQLSKKLYLAAEAVEKADVKAVERVAQKVKRAAEKERNRAVGFDGRLSNVGKNGAKLGVRYDFKSQNGKPAALVRATGPWQIVEGDTVPHVITSRYAGGSRLRRGAFGPALPGGRRSVILTPWGYRRYARHPGTKGKHPWRTAITDSTRNLTPETSTPIRDAFREVFR